MKKLLLAFAIAASFSFAFTSCVDEEASYCWQISYILDGVQFTTYQWGPVAVIKNLEQRIIEVGGEKVKYSRTSKYETMEACVEVGNMSTGNGGTIINQPGSTPNTPDTPENPDTPSIDENPDVETPEGSEI